MRNQVKPIVTAVITLIVVTAVVVAALGFTDMLTKDTIEQQTIAATNAACQAFFEKSEVTELTPASGKWIDGVLAVYEAKRDGQVCGYVVKTSTSGKASGLEVMTGIDGSGAVVGVQVVNENETANYVKNVEKGGLFDRLIGKKKDEVAAVDGVSQATKTSNGIKDGVSLALKVYEEVKANG